MPLCLDPLLSELTILTKRSTYTKLSLSGDSDYAWCQRAVVDEVERQYNLGLPVRIIVLKARQLGISTICQGILYNWMFIHPGTNGLVMAHDAENSAGLFEKARLFWDEWPLRNAYTLSRSTIRRMHWKETRSSLKVATAKNVGSGRSQTVQALHASEAAFYMDPEELMTGLNNSIPNEHGTIIIIESTANGMGNWFQREWARAEDGETDFVPVFLPWHHHHEYERNPTPNLATDLDADEVELLKVPGMTLRNIAFRRWTIDNKFSGDTLKFSQEFPATPEEAFISTGHNIFPLARVRQCYSPPNHTDPLTNKPVKSVRGMLVDDGGISSPVRWVYEPSGSLTVFKAPTKKDLRQDRYMIGGDPSETLNGDPACMQVINRQTNEQVAVWHGHVDPTTFAQEMIRLGKWYHNAMLCPEAEGGGQAAIGYILASGYPNVWIHKWADKAPGKASNSYGWSMNWNRKRLAIGVLAKLFVDRSIIIHDRETYYQLVDYVVLDNGEWDTANPANHADAIMALAITVAASSMEGPFVADIGRPSPILDLFTQAELTGTDD